MGEGRGGGRLRVGILFGGKSGEHEVSLAGAASVIAALDRARFEPVPIGITLEGRWLGGGDPLRALSEEAARRALTSGGHEEGVKRARAGRARMAPSRGCWSWPGCPMSAPACSPRRWAWTRSP